MTHAGDNSRTVRPAVGQLKGLEPFMREMHAEPAAAPNGSKFEWPNDFSAAIRDEQ